MKLIPSSELSSKLSCFFIVQKEVVKVLSIKRAFSDLTEGGKNFSWQKILFCLIRLGLKELFRPSEGQRIVREGQ